MTYQALARMALVGVLTIALAGCAQNVLAQRVNRIGTEARAMEAKCPSAAEIVARGRCLNAVLRQTAAGMWPGGTPAAAARVLDAHAAVFDAHAAGGVSDEETWRRHKELDTQFVAMLKGEIDVRNAEAQRQDRALATIGLIGVMAAKGATAKPNLPAKVDHKTPSKAEKTPKVDSKPTEPKKPKKDDEAP